MKRKIVYGVSMIAVFILLSGCISQPSTGTNDSQIGLANPASVYCANQSGELEIRDTATGQVGYCIFDDGSECEEWAFYNGDCAKGETQANETTADCETLYWYDNNSECCGQKEFCGMFMYQGLHTFETSAECETSLNDTNNGS